MKYWAALVPAEWQMYIRGKDHKLNRYGDQVLKSDFRTDEVFIQKFLSEAQAAAGLMHPNVVNVYDVERQDRGLYYMVMELVEGSR